MAKGKKAIEAYAGYGFMVLGVLLYLLGLWVLPTEIVAQFQLTGGGEKVHKALVLLTPLALSVGLGLSYQMDKNKSERRLLLAGLGIVLYVLTFVANLR